MFEEIRKRISNAIKGISRREEEKAEEEAAKAKAGAREEPSQRARSEVTTKKEKQNREETGLEVSLATKIKGAILGNVSLGEGEITDFADKIKLSLIESDVSYDVADELSKELHDSLKGMKVSPSMAEEEFLGKVRESMANTLSKSAAGIDIKRFVEDKIRENDIPVKILFLGPNGTGKTTTIAKIAYLFKNNGISSVISASDTFRAAAIEQTEMHAKRVGVPVVKSTYGADPASVAFDAIAHAKSHNLDLVLIDSAGRQETNKNLVMEVQKLARVSKPDITIFVGESTAGNALPNQVREFSNFVKINGIILTKLDCDAKGGNALSIASTTGIPILFFGTGERYDALVRFDPAFVVNSILPPLVGSADR